MALVAHISDTHLGKRQYNLVEREEDLYDAFREAIEKILEEHVKLVIHSGDFFENPRPPPRALLEAARGLKLLKEKGIIVLGILGDHDTARRRGEIPPHAILEDMGLLRVVGIRGNLSLEIEVDGERVLVAGLIAHPARYRRTLIERMRIIENIAGKFKGRKILVLHQSIKEFFPLSYEISLGELPKGFNYYAMGHLHFRASKVLGESLLSYAGSTEIMSKSEIRDYESMGKGFSLVDLSSNPPSLNWINLSSIRRQISVEVDFENLKTALQKLVEEAAGLRKKPLVHVLVKGKNIDRPLAYRIIRNVLERHTLTYRPSFEEEVEEEEIRMIIGEREVVDEMAAKIAEKILGSKSKAMFSLELCDLLYEGRLEEALKKAVEFYESGEWSK